MRTLNTASIEAHTDNNDSAHNPTPVRLRCTCGDCPACRSTPLLPAIATSSLSHSEVSPAPGGGGDTDAREHEERTLASNRGADAIENGAAPGNEPAAALAPATTTRPQGGSGVATRWPGDHRERVSKQVSEAAMTAALKKFDDIVGQMLLSEVTPVDVERFVDGLRREGKRESMVLRYLWAMKAITELLRTFEHSGGGNVNPFAQAAELVRLPEASNEPALPFTLEKLQRLLSSPGYSAMKDAAEPHRAARFWLPLLCLFTCSRAKEVMRLEVSELERHGDAWVLRVSSTMSADPRTGGAAMRWVPLHDELVRCGFVAYVVQRKLDGHVKMFGPGAEAETLSASAHQVSYWFSRLAQALGLGPECNLHALRRAFVAACLHSGIGIEGIRMLAGRMADVPASLRALPPSLAHTDALDQAIACVRRLRFDGLDVSHLYTDDAMGRA